MKIFFALIFSLLIIGSTKTQDLGIREVRRLFFVGTAEPCDIETLYEKLKGRDLKNDPVFLAYQGTSEAMMADCVRGPFKKLDYFNRGRDKLESAIQMKPGNMEIRYLRFQIQIHIPDLLNYDNIEEDKRFLFNYLTRGKPLDQYETGFLNKVTETLLYSDRFTEREKRELRKVVNQ